MFEALAIAFATICGVGLVTAYIYDWVQRRRRRNLLAVRPELSDGAFAHRFFAGSQEQARIAICLRRILEENLGQSLSGLDADDRLEEDLYAELLMNLDLFWTLEREFGISTSVMDFATHQPEVEQLHTFRDLVKYVEARVAKEATAKMPADD